MSPAGQKSWQIPLNMATNEQQLSNICSIFALRKKRTSQLTARIDGIDGDSLFGNTRPPCSCSGLLAPFAHNSGPHR